MKCSIVFLGLSLLANVTHAQPPATAPAEDLSEFRTVATAIPAKPLRLAKEQRQGAYVGVAVKEDSDGKVVVTHVDPGSPAATAGFREGDVIVQSGPVPVAHIEVLRDQLLNATPGESIRFEIQRDGKKATLTVTPAAISKPMKAPAERAVIGILLEPVDSPDGQVVQAVTANFPAARAGIRPRDAILKVDGTPVVSRQMVMDLLSGHAPGEQAKLTIRRGEKTEEVTVTTTADRSLRGLRAAIDRVSGGLFKKPVYRLAVIGVEYPDIKHNPKISTADWDRQIFSTGNYHSQNATGQTVFGSVNDYYVEVSCDGFHIEGKVFDWIEVSRKRAEYSPGTGTGDTQKMLPEILDKFTAREGKDALDGFDGVAFIYAGERMQTSRGGLFWPHRAMMPYAGKRLNYLIVPEGGAKMTNISVFTHEFGHMLGLPDLYARPENPGSEGLGFWCLMSQDVNDGRPQHMSAWCKEQLGWLTPTVIDPATPQKLVLSPVEGSNRECFKIPLRADGSEYLLLENRKKTRFDAELPGEGLLIWRVAGGRPLLIASHGIEGPAGTRYFQSFVPYPSSANRALTPVTTPSSRSVLGGGAPVYITEIERRADGKITFLIGYESI